ncbi:BnaA02g05280D [Brassica napus]|uniref:BnaA02g05280D protein n=1 Tax=Brassica napus TaxID=3708 RepID=A0A078F7M7_BRANA|nr:BnaA02g05280D [Brassica napus]
MHSPFTACLSQKEDNSVVVDGGAVVEFFCLSISYGYCLESLESERLLYETKYLNVFFLHHQRNKNRIRSRNHNPSSLAQNRTAFFPPQHWKIDGIVNPQYKSGPPVRVDPTGFPDPSGLQATTYAFASWQVICNITKPKPKAARCCVSYSAFYNDSAIPCNTCACGCADIDTDTCNANARQLLLPPDSLLVPFENRTLKAKVWAKRKHMAFIKKLPCPDNCGISLNWHVNSDYADGWSASVTVFNWGANAVEDWFAAVDLG